MPTVPTMPVNRVCRPVPRCDAVLRRGAGMGSPGKGGKWGLLRLCGSYRAAADVICAAYPRPRELMWIK